MSAEEQMREIALDWLKNSDDDNTKALRGYVLQMLSGANLQISEATIKERDRILEILEGCHENCTGACGACLAEQRIRVPLKPK